MVDAYVATVYATAATAQTAINTTTADKLVTVVTFQEGSKWKFLVVAKV